VRENAPASWSAAVLRRFPFLSRLYASLLGRLVPPHDDKPRAFVIALATNHGHAFADRPEHSLNYSAVLESGHFSAVVVAQVNFNLSIFAEANAGGLTGTDRNLPTVKLPIAFPVERGPQMARYFDSDRVAARLRGRILIVAAHELDVKGVGAMFGGRRSVQNECNKQYAEDSASHKAQRVELY